MISIRFLPAVVVLVMLVACSNQSTRIAQELIGEGVGDKVKVSNANGVYVYRNEPSDSGLCVIRGIQSRDGIRINRQTFEAFALPSTADICPNSIDDYGYKDPSISMADLHAILSLVRECSVTKSVSCGELNSAAESKAQMDFVQSLPTLNFASAERYGPRIVLRYDFVNSEICSIASIRFTPSANGFSVDRVGCSAGY